MSFDYGQRVRRLLPPLAALLLVVLLSALVAACGGASHNNYKPGPVMSWGKNGVVRIPGFEVKQTIEDSSGRIVAVGNY